MLDKIILKNKLIGSWKCILMVILGFALLGITFIMPDNTWKIFLQTVSSYFIVSCLLDIIKKLFNDEELIKDIVSGIDSEINAMKLGIKKIDINNEKMLTPEKIIKYAKKRIDILHVYGYGWTRDNQAILAEALKNKVQVRVIIADFNNEISMKFYSNHMNRNVEEKIQEVLKIWENIYDEAGQKDKLQIYLFDGAFTHAIHLNEKYAVIKSIPSCKSYAKGNVTTIYSKKLENGIYEKYEQEINQIVKESTPYTIEELQRSEN